MRCTFDQIDCRFSGEFSCFRCKHCGRNISVATKIVDKLDQVTKHLPECVATPKPSTEAIQVTADPETSTPTPAPSFDPTGPGSQLKRFLSRLGIKSTPTCSCNARAHKMDEMGVDWCQENINEIVGWLKEEAAKRKLPFLSMPTKIVVQRAINLARKARDAQLAESSSAA